jgi:hypothetical protein
VAPVVPVVAFGWAALAAAAPLDASLGWVVAPDAVDCPSRESLHQKLVERMGRDPFEQPDAPRLEVHLQQSLGTYGAEIRSVAGEVRTLRSIGGDAKSCSEVVDAVALTLSLLLEANRDVPAPTETQSSPATSSEPTVFAPSAPIVCEKADGSACPPCPPPPHVRTAWLGVGPLLSLHDLPQAGTGVALMMGLELAAPWEIVAGGLLLGIERKTREDASFAFSLTEGWLGLGLTLPVADGWRWHSELGPVLGVLHSYPENPLPLDPGDSYYGALRLATHVVVTLRGPLGIGAGLSGEMRLKQWVFRVEDTSLVVWRQPWFGGRAEVQAIWELE